ncbi:TPA: 50S ribosomal protein L29 [Candidatus Bipolaricaulota bacterium]|nr:50S ribosomal protein L29 [Candidatus Bipolaricaulota bacterium]
MKAEALRELTNEELREKVRELKRKLLNLRFQIAMNRQENTAALTETKRDIARALTILRERELARQGEGHQSQSQNRGRRRGRGRARRRAKAR